MGLYIQILAILGTLLLEWECLRGAPLIVKTDNNMDLLKGYPNLFKFYLFLSSITLLVCTVVWALQPGLIQIVGWGLLSLGAGAGLLRYLESRLIKEVWFRRLDAFLNLVLLGFALYLKVKELF